MKKVGIKGKPVLLVVDIFESAFEEGPDDGLVDEGIPIMPGYLKNMDNAAELVKHARNKDIPIIVVMEQHRKDRIDFGRELDGQETEHCIEGSGEADLPIQGLSMTENDYIVYKRRYSAFFGTDLQILLNGLKADSIILVGGLTDVCIHYTFVDAHQRDFHCKVACDGVGGSSRKAHEASLEAMEYLQTDSVASCEELKGMIDDYVSVERSSELLYG